MDPTHCQSCGRRRRSGEWACPCGCDAYGPPVLVGEGGDPVVDIPRPFRGVLDGLIEMPPGYIAAFYGPKGIGKTTIALQALVDPWVCTVEMPPELVRGYARRLGVRMAGHSIATLVRDDHGVTRDIDLLATEAGAADILFDSLTATGNPELALSVFRRHVEEHNARGVAILQVTKAGTARGSEELLHNVDVVLRLEASEGVRRIVVEKNRFGPEGQRVFGLGLDGTQIPKRRLYYSVEGDAPHYRLVAYPDNRAVYADCLRYAERLRAANQPEPFELPPPPCAVAARASALYPGGFVEPEDRDARAAFAESQGVPYFSPTHEDDDPPWPAAPTSQGSSGTTKTISGPH